MRAALALAAAAVCALLVCLALSSSQAAGSSSDAFTVLRRVRGPLGLASQAHFPPLPPSPLSSAASLAARSRPSPAAPTPSAPTSVESQEAELARIQAQVVARIQESGLQQSSASATAARSSAKAAAAPAPPLLSQSQLDAKTAELSKGKAASKDGLLQAQQHLNRLKEEEGVLTHELTKVQSVQRRCVHSRAAADPRTPQVLSTLQTMNIVTQVCSQPPLQQRQFSVAAR